MGDGAPVNPRHRPWEEAADFRIGLRPIAPADWLEGGEMNPASRKDALLARDPARVWAELADSRPAQAEALAAVEAATGQTGDPAPPPLWSAARLVSDDLCLMEKRGGAWRLTALSLCAGSYFSAHEVIGRSLAELHGPVTGFAERFGARAERMFEGLRPGLVLERRNWTLLNSAELSTPDPGPIRAEIPGILPEKAGRVLHTRVERQTLRRLPTTGAMLFTIRVWLSPLERLRGSGLAAFAHAWRTAGPDFRAYKRLDLYDDLVEGFLLSSQVSE